YPINAYNTIMKTKTLVIFLLILLCVTPVMAVNVTSWPDGANVTLDNWTITDQTMPPQHYITDQDQMVLNALTKQNDLLSELIKVQWIETCYAPHSDSFGYGNMSAWQSECAKAGYPVG